MGESMLELLPESIHQRDGVALSFTGMVSSMASAGPEVIQTSARRTCRTNKNRPLLFRERAMDWTGLDWIGLGQLSVPFTATRLNYQLPAINYQLTCSWPGCL